MPLPFLFMRSQEPSNPYSNSRFGELPFDNLDPVDTSQLWGGQQERGADEPPLVNLPYKIGSLDASSLVNFPNPLSARPDAKLIPLASSFLADSRALRDEVNPSGDSDQEAPGSSGNDSGSNLASKLVGIWDKAQNFAGWQPEANPGASKTSDPSNRENEPQSGAPSQKAAEIPWPLIAGETLASAATRVPNNFVKLGGMALAAVIAHEIARRQNQSKSPGNSQNNRNPPAPEIPTQSSSEAPGRGSSADELTAQPGQLALSKSYAVAPGWDALNTGDASFLDADNNVMDRRTAEQERLYPGDYSNGRHGALIKAQADMLRRAGCKVETEVRFGASGIPGLARADLVHECVNAPAPTVTEGKTGLLGRFTFNQAAVYPRIAAGGSFSPSQKILTFGLPMNLPLPPMDVVKLWEQYPDQPATEETVFPRAK